MKFGLENERSDSRLFDSLRLYILLISCYVQLRFHIGDLLWFEIL